MNLKPRWEGSQASWKPQGESEEVGFPRKQPQAQNQSPRVGGIPLLITRQHAGLRHKEGQMGQGRHPGEGPSPEKQPEAGARGCFYPKPHIVAFVVSPPSPRSFVLKAAGPPWPLHFLVLPPRPPRGTAHPCWVAQETAAQPHCAPGAAPTSQDSEPGAAAPTSGEIGSQALTSRGGVKVLVISFFTLGMRGNSLCLTESLRGQGHGEGPASGAAHPGAAGPLLFLHQHSAHVLRPGGVRTGQTDRATVALWPWTPWLAQQEIPHPMGSDSPFLPSPQQPGIHAPFWIRPPRP